MPRPALQLGVLCLIGLIALPALGRPVENTVKAQGSQITLNLKDADIRDVAQLVSSITGKNFIIDPRVNGRVTVVSSQPISAEALFEVFLSVLQVHGLVAMPSGHNTWKIVPSVEGRQMPGYTGKLSGAPNAAMVTQVIQLENVKVAQLVPALRPLMSSTAQLAAYAASNALIISGRAANVQRIIGLVHKLDQPMTGEFDFIQLQYASATDVAQVLSTMLGAGAGRGQIPMKIAADPRTNSILVTGSPAARLQVRALVAKLDQPTGRGGNTQVIYLHYGQAAKLAKILKGFVQAKKQAMSGGPSGTEPVINIVADKTINALIATAPPKTMAQIRQLVDALDVRRAQVLVQGIIAELSSRTSAQLGISWAALSSSAAGLTNFPGGVVDLFRATRAGAAANIGGLTGRTGLSLPGGLLFGVGRIVESGTSFVALLRALSGDSHTNILSTPSLVTMDNEKAKLVSGQKVPFVTGTYSNTLGGAGGVGVVNPFQTVNRQQLGLTLTITPHINFGGDTVRLEIHVKDSSLGPVQPGTSQPSTSNREIKTTVIVKDKQILVLGGLINTQLQHSTSQVPLLGDIPLLGVLFRYQKSEKVRKNLMIFLRPVILRNAADVRAVTRPRYNQIRQFQIGRGTEVPLLPGVKPPVLPILTPSPATGQSPITEHGALIQSAPSPATAPAASTANHVNHG